MTKIKENPFSRFRRLTAATIGIASAGAAFAGDLAPGRTAENPQTNTLKTGIRLPDDPAKDTVEKPAGEAENAGSDDAAILSETKVTSKIPVKNSRLQSPIPQTGVTREEFGPRNNRRVGDVIQRLPGVLVDGPAGSNQDVRLRGLDKEFTRVQVDGVQLPNGGEKREFQVNQLPSFMVGQVNVIRNPTADFESDGLAGRVDIKTG